MGTSHALSLGQNNHAFTANPNVLGTGYSDIAARDADSIFNTNADNINNVVRVEDSDGGGTVGYFVLVSTVPLWVGIAGAIGPGTDTWTALLDTPGAISAGLVVQGNAGGTALEFGQDLNTTGNPIFNLLSLAGNLVFTGVGTGTIISVGDLLINPVSGDFRVSASVIPDFDDNDFLGTASNRWLGLFIGGVTAPAEINFKDDLEFNATGSGTIASRLATTSTDVDLEIIAPNIAGRASLNFRDVSDVLRSSIEFDDGLDQLIINSDTILTLDATTLIEAKQNFTLSHTQNGSDVFLEVINESLTPGSGAVLFLGVAGSTAGDPYIHFGVTAGEQWSMGADNSFGDQFKISNSAILGVNDFLVINPDTNIITISADLVPDTDGGRNLGSVLLRWNTFFTASVIDYIGPLEFTSQDGTHMTFNTSPTTSDINIFSPDAVAGKAQINLFDSLGAQQASLQFDEATGFMDLVSDSTIGLQVGSGGSVGIQQLGGGATFKVFDLVNSSGSFGASVASYVGSITPIGNITANPGDIYYRAVAANPEFWIHKGSGSDDSSWEEIPSIPGGFTGTLVTTPDVLTDLAIVIGGGTSVVQSGDGGIAGTVTLDADAITFTAINQISLASEVDFVGGTQNYRVGHDNDKLTLQSLDTGVDFAFDFYTNDGDGTDELGITFYNVGTPGSIINNENLFIGSENNEWWLLSNKAGTGTLRDIVIGVSLGNPNQIRASANGVVTLNSLVTVDTTGQTLDIEAVTSGIALFTLSDDLGAPGLSISFNDSTDRSLITALNTIDIISQGADVDIVADNDLTLEGDNQVRILSLSAPILLNAQTSISANGQTLDIEPITNGTAKYSLSNSVGAESFFVSFNDLTADTQMVAPFLFDIISDAGNLNLTATAGEINLTAGAGGMTLDSTGLLIIRSDAASDVAISAGVAMNITADTGDTFITTSVGDLNLVTGGQIVMNSLVTVDTTGQTLDVEALTSGIARFTLSDDAGVVVADFNFNDSTDGTELSATGELVINTPMFLGVNGGQLELTSGTTLSITSGGTGDITINGADDVNIIATDNITFSAVGVGNGIVEPLALFHNRNDGGDFIINFRYENDGSNPAVIDKFIGDRDPNGNVTGSGGDEYNRGSGETSGSYESLEETTGNEWHKRDVSPPTRIIINSTAEYEALGSGDVITVTGTLTLIFNVRVFSATVFDVQAGADLALVRGNIGGGIFSDAITAATMFTGSDASLVLDGVVLISQNGMTLFDWEHGESQNAPQNVGIRNNAVFIGFQTGEIRKISTSPTGGAFQVRDSSFINWLSGLTIIDTFVNTSNVGLGQLTTGDAGEAFYNVLSTTQTLPPQVKITNPTGQLKAGETLVRFDPGGSSIANLSISGSNLDFLGDFFDTTGIAPTAFTGVVDNSLAATAITSVAAGTNGTVARFDTGGAIPILGQTATISGFITNTDYNVTGRISFTSGTTFEIEFVVFGTTETGSVLANGVTITSTAHGLADDTGVLLDTDDVTDYDGGFHIYNETTNTFDVSTVFTETQTGTWSTQGLDQQAVSVLAINNQDLVDSHYIATAFVNNNVAASGPIVNGVFTDMTFGFTPSTSLIEGSTRERWKLIDPVICLYEYTGNEPFDGLITSDATSESSGGAQDFRYKWLHTITAFISENTIGFDVSGVIADTGFGFLNAGFRVGDNFAVTNTASNNGNYKIAAIQADQITVSDEDTLVSEAVGTATLTGTFGNLPDDVEGQSSIGSTAKSISKTFPLAAVKGDQIKPAQTRNSGSSSIIHQFFSMYATM